MAGILDFLFRPQGQGMLDFGTEPGQSQMPQGLFGMDPNALLYGGMGMLGNGWQGALQGIMAGRKQAAEQEAAKQFQSMFPQMLGMDRGQPPPTEFRAFAETWIGTALQL